MRSVQEMSETISMLSDAFGYDALDEMRVMNEEDIDDTKYPVGAYRDSFLENLEQVERALSAGENLDPRCAFRRLSASAHNLYMRVKCGDSGEVESQHEHEADDILSSLFYTVPVDENVRSRLYGVTEKLFQKHDHTKYDYIDVSRIYDLCLFDPKLARICADYPENISVDELVDYEAENTGLCGMIGNVIDYRHVSRSGQHVMHIKPKDDESDLIDFAFAENRDGVGFFYDMFGHSGERVEFLDPYENDVGRAQDADEEDPYCYNKLQTLREFIDFAQGVFDRFEGRKNNSGQPEGP